MIFSIFPLYKYMFFPVTNAQNGFSLLFHITCWCVVSILRYCYIIHRDWLLDRFSGKLQNSSKICNKQCWALHITPNICFKRIKSPISKNYPLANLENKNCQPWREKTGNTAKMECYATPWPLWWVNACLQARGTAIRAFTQLKTEKREQ